MPDKLYEWKMNFDDAHGSRADREDRMSRRHQGWFWWGVAVGIMLVVMVLVFL